MNRHEAIQTNLLNALIELMSDQVTGKIAKTVSGMPVAEFEFSVNGNSVTYRVYASDVTGCYCNPENLRKYKTKADVRKALITREWTATKEPPAALVKLFNS